MTRRNLAAISVLLIFLQAAVSLSRAITLTVERRADIDLFGHDPLLDIIANFAFFGLGAGLGIAMLFRRRRGLWLAATLLLGIALVEAVWLVAVDFGGLPNLPLLLIRGFALIVLLTDDARRQFE